MTIIYRSLQSLALSLAIATSAVGQVQNDDDLDQRQAKAVAVINDVGAIERAHGYFRTALLTYYYGDKGVKTVADTFFRESHLVIEDLNQTARVFRISDERSFATAARTVEDMFRKKAQALSLLEAKQHEISHSVQRLEQLVGKSKTQPLAATDMLRPVSEQVIAGCARAVSSAHTIDDDVTKSLTATRRLVNEGRRAIIERLRQAMIQAGLGHLDASLRAVAEATAYEAEVVPILLALETKEETLGRYVTDLAYFGAKDAYLDGKAACAAFQGSLAPIAVAAAQKSQALARKESVCTGIENHWRGLAAIGLSNAGLVKEYARVKTAVYRRECELPSPKINCEKFAVLRAISETKLTAMDPERLKFYENSWTELGAGL